MKLENFGDQKVQLIDRQWKIFSAPSKTVFTFRAPGVNGQVCKCFGPYLMLLVSRLDGHFFIFQWGYFVKLENFGDQTVQLIDRQWKIFSAPSKAVFTFKAPGVNGQVCKLYGPVHRRWTGVIG